MKRVRIAAFGLALASVGPAVAQTPAALGDSAKGLRAVARAS